jgi:hypothetical protein
MTAFKYKGYGRIYTDEKNVLNVIRIIKELDEFEYQNYFPTYLVTSWDNYPLVVCIGKFELDECEFLKKCKESNIPVFIFDSGDIDYPKGYSKILTKNEIQQLSYGELK